MKIQLNIKRLLGIVNWNHTVSIDGRWNANNSFIFHLRRYIMVAFNLDLFKFNEWNLSQSQKESKLWNMSKEMMSQRLNQRAQLAGYQKNLFSFHSLRSGFMCSAVIKSSMNII
jgi:hypothetical protein